MVNIVADKILRITSPSGKVATSAELFKLTTKEKELERQLRDVKGATASDGQQQQIRALENALKDVRKKMEPLKLQLEALKTQEAKEAKASAEARTEAAKEAEGKKNPYAPLFKTDLTALRETDEQKKDQPGHAHKDKDRDETDGVKKRRHRPGGVGSAR